MKDIDRVLDALTETLRPLVLTAFAPDSCVATVRIGLDVLQYFGVTAKAVPVEVAAYNAEAVALLQQYLTTDPSEDPMLTLQRQLETNTLERPGGPWSIGLGVASTPDPREAGHVAIAIPARQCLLDLSLDQASRPHKGMLLTPQKWSNVPSEWFEERERMFDAWLPQPSGGDVLLRYRHSPHALYRRSPNWQRRITSSAQGPAVFRGLTAQAISAMKATLA